MRHMSNTNLAWISVAALTLAGCSAADTASAELGEQAEALDTAPLAEPVPTLDEFIESTRLTAQVDDQVLEQYVIEGDMVVPYDLAVDYYEARYLTPDTVKKGVGAKVTTISGRIISTRFLKYDLNAFFPAITYCFDNSISASEKPSFIAALATATSTWDRASGPLRFTYDSSLDGANCKTTGSGAPAFLGFAVKKGSGAASQGTLPGQANRFLSLTSLSAAHVLHEVGHIIGLAHEENHTKSTLGCAPEQGLPSGAVFADLTTGWDPQSIMQSLDESGRAACAHAFGGVRAILSSGDGVAARALYGN